MYMFHIIRKLVPKTMCSIENRHSSNMFCMGKYKTIIILSKILFLRESAANVHILPVASMVIIGR